MMGSKPTRNMQRLIIEINREQIIASCWFLLRSYCMYFSKVKKNVYSLACDIPLHTKINNKTYCYVRHVSQLSVKIRFSLNSCSFVVGLIVWPNLLLSNCTLLFGTLYRLTIAPHLATINFREFLHPYNP
jgi:hypothetical protein